LIVRINRMSGLTDDRISETPLCPSRGFSSSRALEHRNVLRRRRTNALKGSCGNRGAADRPLRTTVTLINCRQRITIIIITERRDHIRVTIYTRPYGVHRFFFKPYECWTSVGIWRRSENISHPSYFAFISTRSIKIHRTLPRTHCDSAGNTDQTTTPFT